MSKPARVLFIENDEVDRRLFLLMVRHKALPWEVTVAESLTDARAHLAQSRFDVIVADNHMPDGKSYELFGEIQDTPFVLIAEILEEQLALQTLERGADDYLLKDMEHGHIEAVPFAVEKTLYRKAIHEKEQRLVCELRESEQRLRATFENAASGIAQMDNQDRLVAVNDRLCQMLGYSREEMLRKSVHELTYPEDRPRSDDLNAQLREGRLPWFQYEKRYLKRDGSPLWVHVAVSAVLDEEGRFLYSVGTVVDISARKAAEAEVHLLAAAMEAAPNAVSVSKTDPQGTIVWVNPAFTRLTGYSPEEAIGQSHHLLSSGQQDEAFYRQLWETIARGGVWRGELVNRRKDGTLYYEEMGITPLRDENGNVTHYVAIKQDITERKRAQDVLRDSESRYRAYFHLPMVGIAVTAPDTGWIEVNPALCDMLGYGREELMCRTWSELTHPEDVELDLIQFQRVLAGEIDGYNLEKRFIRKDQTIIWVDLSVHCVRSRSGDVSYFIALLKDVTDRKHAEEELRKSEERFRALVDATSEVLYRMSPDWSEMRHLHSRGFLANTDAPSRTWFQDYIPPADQPRVLAAISDAIRKKSIFELEHRVIRNDGTLGWTFSRAVPLLDERGDITEWFGAASDITDRKQADEELTAAKLSAEQASKAKDHFLSVLSHELRTPLTPVMAAVSMLQDDPQLNGGMREKLEMVRRNVELEARLIDDLLDMTRIARGKVELEKKPVMLCEVIRRAVEVCKPDIEARRLHFGVDLGPDPPYVVNGDEARLQQVFWNLLKNAVKFTPHGGCIGIRCRLDARTVTAEVSDSGMGIERADLALIFNAFEQAERSVTRQFGGLGLGLAIAKSIVEMHGGAIEAHSQGKNSGATFCVQLPILANAHAATTGGGQPATHVPSTTALRILLVEDHGDTAMMMQTLLSMDGHEVYVTGDVAAALEEVGKRPFDLLLSDLGLPDASGLDLMRELRARGYMMPGIALSGYGQDQDIQRSKEAGFAVHLTKPTNPERLAEAIASVSRQTAD